MASREQGKDTADGQPGQGREQFLWAASVSAVVAAVAVGHVVWPGHIDTIFLALLALAFLPWLAPLIKSIKVGGWEIEFRELEQRLAEAEGLARSASRTADTLGEALLAGRGRAASSSEGERPPDEELAELIEEYKSVQKGMKRGTAKMGRLTRIVGRMIALAPMLRQFDIAAALRGKDQGRLVAAYAALYARPDGAMLGELVRALTGRKQRAFAQFWGIKAAGKVLQASRPEDTPDALFQLREFLARVLKPGTDRHAELSQVLNGAGDDASRRPGEGGRLQPRG